MRLKDIIIFSEAARWPSMELPTLNYIENGWEPRQKARKPKPKPKPNRNRNRHPETQHGLSICIFHPRHWPLGALFHLGSRVCLSDSFECSRYLCFMLKGQTTKTNSQSQVPSPSPRPRPREITNDGVRFGLAGASAVSSQSRSWALEENMGKIGKNRLKYNTLLRFQLRINKNIYYKYYINFNIDHNFI